MSDVTTLGLVTYVRLDIEEMCDKFLVFFCDDVLNLTADMW